LKTGWRRSRWLLGVMAIAIPISLLAGALAVRDALQQRIPDGSLYTPGSTDGWISYGGTWEVAGGAIQNDSIERGAKFMKGDSRWSDYSFESDLESLSKSGRVGLIVRSTDEERGVDSYTGYYIGLRWPENIMLIGRSDYGWAEYAHVNLRTVLLPRHWYHLQVFAVGCTIAAQFSDPATGDSSSMSIDDDSRHCVTSGRIGLRSMATLSAWKNIRIHSASAADLRPILAAVNPAKQQSPPFTLREKLDAYKEYHLAAGSTPDLRGAEPTEPIDNLRVASALGTDSVSVRGKVILTAPVLYVQDSTGGAAIPNTQVAKLNIGDEVLVQGKADPHPFSSVIKDAKVTMLWPGVPDPPLSITPFQAATGTFDARFVELQSRLGSANEKTPHRLILELYAGDQRFRALLDTPATEQSVPLPTKESLLQIRGVCVTDSQYTHNQVPFVILLRSANDLKIISGPPWWSTRNLATGAFVVVLLSLLGYLLYTRAEQWRLQAVIEERLRLAHELHDTLAQSFAGIGFQLRAILKNLRDTSSPLREQVEMASELVRQGHQEARRSITSLRADADRHQIELLPALVQAAQRMISDNSIVVETSVSGDPRRIPLQLTDVLFRVGQEAIANVIRHANASRIRMHLEYRRDTLQLSIEDNGVGFALDESTSVGFGLNGIRERVRTVGGIVQVSCLPGSGTSLHVEAPLQQSSLLAHLYRWLRSSARHGSV
jgi:signal transduction histidine kinase